MTALLPDLERKGYRFELRGDRLLAEGPGLDDPATVERLRAHKPDILRELRVRAFIDLVRHIAAGEHGRLLHPGDIRRELDQSDIADLLRTTRETRQAWAASIAARLAAPDPSWQPALDALREAR